MSAAADSLRSELQQMIDLLGGPRDEEGNLVASESFGRFLVRIRDLAMGASALALELDERLAKLEEPKRDQSKTDLEAGSPANMDPPNAP